jgi:hypothetical protein
MKKDTLAETAHREVAVQVDAEVDSEDEVVIEVRLSCHYCATIKNMVIFLSQFFSRNRKPNRK